MGTRQERPQKIHVNIESCCSYQNQTDEHIGNWWIISRSMSPPEAATVDCLSERDCCHDADPLTLAFWMLTKRKAGGTGGK